jgi:hypothetical protein
VSDYRAWSTAPRDGEPFIVKFAFGSIRNEHPVAYRDEAFVDALSGEPFAMREDLLTWRLPFVGEIKREIEDRARRRKGAA